MVRDIPPAATGPGGEWRRYLHDVCELLWPPPAVITLDDGGTRWSRGEANESSPEAADSVVSEYLLIPGARRPPLLVPAEPRLAAAAVRHYRAPRAWFARTASNALSIGLARGFGRSLVRGRIRVTQPREADTVEGYLRAAFSQEVRVSMYLGPARANRKPVLQLLSPAGKPLGYAKIGINPLTRDLVRTEQATLLRLAGAKLAGIRVPRVLHFDQWHGYDVLVLDVLPVWLRDTPCPPQRLAAAMVEVSRMDGLRTAPLADSTYLTRLRARLTDADDDPQRAALLQALDALVARAGSETLTFGAWHGDWSPWNMSNTRQGLLLWDWERFSSDVPVGFDALHRWVQTEVGPGRREPLAVATQCPDRAPDLIAPFGIDGRQARLTASLYLAELATRYLVDRQAQAGARLGTPGAWLIPAISAEAARL